MVINADGAEKTSDQYLSWYQIGTKSIMLYRSNEILKNFDVKF